MKRYYEVWFDKRLIAHCRILPDTPDAAHYSVLFFPKETTINPEDGLEDVHFRTHYNEIYSSTKPDIEAIQEVMALDETEYWKVELTKTTNMIEKFQAIDTAKNIVENLVNTNPEFHKIDDYVKNPLESTNGFINEDLLKSQICTLYNNELLSKDNQADQADILKKDSSDISPTDLANTTYAVNQIHDYLVRKISEKIQSDPNAEDQFRLKTFNISVLEFIKNRNRIDSFITDFLNI